MHLESSSRNDVCGPLEIDHDDDGDGDDDDDDGGGGVHFYSA